MYSGSKCRTLWIPPGAQYSRYYHFMYVLTILFSSKHKSRHSLIIGLVLLSLVCVGLLVAVVILALNLNQQNDLGKYSKTS